MQKLQGAEINSSLKHLHRTTTTSLKLMYMLSFRQRCADAEISCLRNIEMSCGNAVSACMDDESFDATLALSAFDNFAYLSSTECTSIKLGKGNANSARTTFECENHGCGTYPQKKCMCKICILQINKIGFVIVQKSPRATDNLR